MRKNKVDTTIILVIVLLHTNFLKLLYCCCKPAIAIGDHNL